jgi:hypothetical protein
MFFIILLLTLIVIVNADNTITQNIKDTEIYVVQPNVGLGLSNKGISYLIIQIKEITTTHSLLILPLRAYMKLYQCTLETNY